MGKAKAKAFLVVMILVFAGFAGAFWYGLLLVAANGEADYKRHRACIACLDVLDGMERFERCGVINDPDLPQRRAAFKRCLDTKRPDQRVELAP